MIYHETEHGVLYCGSCLDVIKQLPDNSVDSIVTDPPYELGFMGKSWDNTGIAYNVDMWRECLRVLKPGGHLLSFGGSRTYHRMACAIEDAGFEVRDMIEYMYGSGFPKSLNIGKAVDKLQGNERENAGENPNKKGRRYDSSGGFGSATLTDNGINRGVFATKGSTPYEGYGTALKPAHEPICMARKPISEKTIAENVLRWGTGGINVDGCRVALNGEAQPTGSAKRVFANNEYSDIKKYGDNVQTPEAGRFPANLIHDGSDEVLECFPETKSGETKSTQSHNGDSIFGNGGYRSDYSASSGSASRFFYCAKASKAEREIGNYHPTVKPKALMQYLCRLITPKGGIVLEPFAGSGTTLCSAIREGFKYVGIEMQSEYCEIAVQRITSELDQTRIAL